MHARPWILGISWSHNASACLLHGSEVVVAIQEERLTRQKRDRPERPLESLALSFCLDAAGLPFEQLDAVAHVANVALLTDEMRPGRLPHHRLASLPFIHVP